MATQAKGMKSSTLFGFEDSYGTKQTAAAKVIKLPFNSNTLSSTQSLITPGTITGTRNPVQPGLGQIDVSGNIVIPLCARNIGYLLKGVFGAPTTSADASGKIYTHVFKLTEEQPSFTMEKGFNDIGKYTVYTGCKISKLQFNAEVGNNETTVQADLMAADETIESATINTNAKMQPVFRFDNINATIKQGGTVLGTGRKMSLDIDCGLDGDTYCLNGKSTRPAINEGVMGLSGSLTTLFTGLDLLNLAINGTETSLELLFKAGKFSLSLLLPEVQLQRKSPEISGSKGITLDTEFQAFFSDDTQKSAIVATLINDVASY